MKENSNLILNGEAADNAENKITYLDSKEIGEFARRISGKSEEGISKAVVSYQTYAIEDADDSPEKERIYSAGKASVELSINMKRPDFYVMDIIFQSYDEPELKLLWGRLQKFQKNLVTEPDKTWIFYFNILERAGVTSQTLERDTLLVANVFNPTIFYLTREVPNMLSTDTVSENGELHGGNIVRMLIPRDFVTFQITNDIDTSQIKGEVQRENDAREYIDNNCSAANAWSE